jgi:hypothetical protein
MEGTLCLAGRSGKQHTYALLDEWIPKVSDMDRDAAMVELAVRYFGSHGPATLQDFAWWAGITVKDAHAGIDAAGARLSRERVGTREYFCGAGTRRRTPGAARPHVKLLPAFDEYTVAYADRSPLVEETAGMKAMAVLGPVVVMDGRVIGHWKRVLGKRAVEVSAKLLRPLEPAGHEALADAARDYGRFLGLQAELRVRSPRAMRRKSSRSVAS